MGIIVLLAAFLAAANASTGAAAGEEGIID
jgi:hypothetical protein